MLFVVSFFGVGFLSTHDSSGFAWRKWVFCLDWLLFRVSPNVTTVFEWASICHSFITTEQRNFFLFFFSIQVNFYLNQSNLNKKIITGACGNCSLIDVNLNQRENYFLATFKNQFKLKSTYTLPPKPVWTMFDFLVFAFLF